MDLLQLIYHSLGHPSIGSSCSDIRSYQLYSHRQCRSWLPSWYCKAQHSTAQHGSNCRTIPCLVKINLEPFIHHDTVLISQPSLFRLYYQIFSIRSVSYPTSTLATLPCGGGFTLLYSIFPDWPYIILGTYSGTVQYASYLGFDEIIIIIHQFSAQRQFELTRYSTFSILSRSLSSSKE